jgi:cell division protease FtsH
MMMKQNVFETIIGYEGIKSELLRILDQLKNPDKYAALGVLPPHGLLLHGNPGVGKSTLAKCFLSATERNTFIC